MTDHNFNSPALRDFDPLAYHFFGMWKQSLFALYCWVACWNSELTTKLGLKARGSGLLILRDGNFFISNAEIANIKMQVFEKIDAHDGAFFTNLVSVADAEFAAAVAYAERLQGEEPTAESLKAFLTVACRVNFLWYMAAEQLSEAAQEKLSEVVALEKFAAERVADIIPPYSTPLSEQHKEVLAFKKLVGERTLAEIKNDTGLYTALEEHVSRFAWIEVKDFEGQRFTIEKLYEQIRSAKDEPKVERPADCIASPNLAFHASCLSQCGYVRQAAAEHHAMMGEKALHYLQSIAARLGLTYQEFLSQTHEELFAGLRGELSTEHMKENAKRRAHMDFVTFAARTGETIFVEDPDDIRRLSDLMLPKAEAGSAELRGQVGNRGNYKGPVRIIMNTREFFKMQVGDVLVSTMTTPDFVVLMQMAGAIVTDIGGMLCHAAIVSREINKPCVIGTKFATQVLKDGDLVEVDADNGVVRLIERKG